MWSFGVLVVLKSVLADSPQYRALCANSPFEGAGAEGAAAVRKQCKCCCGPSLKRCHCPVDTLQVWTVTTKQHEAQLKLTLDRQRQELTRSRNEAARTSDALNAEQELVLELCRCHGLLLGCLSSANWIGRGWGRLKQQGQGCGSGV